MFRCSLIVVGLMFSQTGMGLSHPASARQEFAIRIVSSRSDSVSGGDVLVDLGPPMNFRWSAQLNGQEVTTAFRHDEKTGHELALLDGLELGRNTLKIRAPGSKGQSIDIINHPMAGPIFSGNHQAPFICQTEVNGLGPPLDVDCSARSIVKYYYKSTEPVETDLLALESTAESLGPGFKPYDLSAPSPIDVAKTVTRDGRTVPYIVRREVGTINRAVYDIELLHQPGQPLPTPWTQPTPGWIGSLVYLVVGGCGAGYRQGALAGEIGAANEPFLSQGFATATATLSVAGVDCNDRISAETLAMVKEHFVKQFGVPRHTIGWGSSGGAINQQLTAQNYPGLLDGLALSISFPDEASTAQSITDCALLDRAFGNSNQSWTEQQKTAVSGFATWRTCTGAWTDGQGHPWGILDPSQRCPPLIPKQMIYDPTANPKGLKCDIYNNEVNVFGRNPQTGFAFRPLDNVGVQYGLAAFNSGQINADQFIGLNTVIGGYDADGHIVPSRSEADFEAIRRAYQRGIVLTGGGGLSEVPIIDEREYADDEANNHDSFRSFVTRARLIAANGNAQNQVILVYPRQSALELLASKFRRDIGLPERTRELVFAMDGWLRAIAADNTSGTLSAKVVRDKPADLVDGCWTTDGEHISEPASHDKPTRCNRVYPSYGDPRIAAGGPLADDVLKCALKPISASDYAKPLTAEQLARIKTVFPTGVCDYSRAGVGQEVTRTVWQRF